ncbi:hypothetical protein MBLNU457_g2990t1 [Dothideomycetes sp. NU457]
MSPSADVFGTTELLCMILSFIPPNEASDPIIDQEPRAPITAARARSLYQLLSCQRVCRTWRSAIQHDINIRRLIFLSPSSHPSRDWIVSHEATQYPDRADTRPILNPMIQHRFAKMLFTFAPLHNFGAIREVRHQAYLKIDRADFVEWTNMALPLPASRSFVVEEDTQLTSEVWPSWCRMQLSIPAVHEVTCIPWDWTSQEGTRGKVFQKGSLRDDIGLTLGLIMAEVGGLFNEYPILNAVNVYTTLHSHQDR